MPITLCRLIFVTLPSQREQFEHSLTIFGSEASFPFFDSTPGFEEEAFVVANFVEDCCETREVGFVFAKVDVAFGLDVNLADEVVAHVFDGGIDVFAAAHHVAGVVIHEEVFGIAEALEEFEDALVGDGGLDADGDAVLFGIGENLFGELGDAGDFFFAFGEVRRAKEGEEEEVAAEGFASCNGLLHDGEAFFALLAFFPNDESIQAAGAEGDDFDVVLFGGGEELLLKFRFGESEDAFLVEVAGVELHALEAGFFGEGNAFDFSAQAEGGFHDGEGGRVVLSE